MDEDTEIYANVMSAAFCGNSKEAAKLLIVMKTIYEEGFKAGYKTK